MNENSKESAFGFVGQFGNGTVLCTGLTKREYFAAMAMQGIISNSELERIRLSEKTEKRCADYAMLSVKYADALLKELENNNSTETK